MSDPTGPRTTDLVERLREVTVGHPRLMDEAADTIERQEAELTFWRDGLSTREVADNMKLWELAARRDASPALSRLSPTDAVPKDWMDLLAEQYPLCPECGVETDARIAPEGRRWICSCGWDGENSL